MRRRNSGPFSLFSFQDIITGLCGIMVFMVLVQSVTIAIGRSADPVEADSASDDERKAIRAEIGELEKSLAKAKSRAAKAVVAIKDKARPGEKEKLDAELTEKELEVAALVSQVHDLETQVEKAKNATAKSEAKVKEMERARRLLEQQLADRRGRRGVTLIPQRGDMKIPIYMVCSWAGIEIYRPFEKTAVVHVQPGEAETTLAEFLASLDHTTHLAVLLVRPTGVKVMDDAVRQLVACGFAYGRDPLEENVEVAFDAGRVE